LTTRQIGALGTTQLVALTTDQIGALKTSQLSSFNTQAVSALSTAQIGALKTSQIGAFTSTQIGALSTEAITALAPTQLGAMTTAGLRGMTSEQACALTTTQLAGLTAKQLAAIPTRTPLILDLNGDGVQTLALGSGAAFDLAASGHSARVGWVSADDGLLVRDLNSDGRITDGTELFGDATRLTDGSRAADGYQALADLDSNHDGKINAADTSFSSLQVWIDANSDGMTQTGELKSLGEFGIASLDLAAQRVDIDNNGNRVGLTSSYAMSDGGVRQMADVWLRTTDASLAANVGSLTQALSAYAEATAVTPAVTGSLNLPTGGTSSTMAAPGSMAAALARFAGGNTLAGPQTPAAASGAGDSDSLLKPRGAAGEGILGSSGS
jgi:hypothetical protein